MRPAVSLTEYRPRTWSSESLDPLGFSAIDDETLMQRVRDRQCLASYTELFGRWHARIRGACFRMTGDWQEAEDLAQEVFCRVFRSRASYEVRSAFGTWIWTIALNLVRDAARRNQRRHVTRSYRSESELPPVAATPVPDRGDEVRGALLKLPPHYREVVVLRHYENLKFRQIAELLGVPPGTVASRMAKALRLLEPILAPVQMCTAGVAETPASPENLENGDAL
jgi:RNA polymerase sigma-70 factor (ECF subfamily)